MPVGVTYPWRLRIASPTFPHTLICCTYFLVAKDYQPIFFDKNILIPITFRQGKEALVAFKAKMH